jgi:hypothetical protein
MNESEKYFSEHVPRYMRKLMQDFGLTLDDAAAVFGNAGHESLGFTAMQEFKPVVAGSRGGWGMFQWTGPRRRAFEAYCERNKLDIKSLDVQYAWLFNELKGPEKGAIVKLKKAVGLDAKVMAFEKGFLRAGVKHYEARKKWARIALAAYAAWSNSPAAAIVEVNYPPLPPIDLIDPEPVKKPSWLSKLFTEMLRRFLRR